VVVAATRVAWTHQLRTGLVLALGLIALISILVSGESVYSRAAILVFDAYLCVAFLGYVFRERRVTGNVVAASLCAYLLIGLLWAYLYMMIHRLEEDPSFKGDAINIPNLTYYSFVTMTTLGYGDITPVTPTARAAAMVEAIVGQIYLVVIVARLVALQITHELQDERKS